MLVLVTGERTEAALSIRKEWVGSDGWLRIPASVRKGKRKSMEYELPQGVLSLLAPLMAAPGEMLFARPFCVGTFYHRYGKLLTAAGLPTGRRWKPQALRRTFASYLKLAGGDATDALNHDSPKTTKDSYLDPTVTDKPQPAGLILRFFGLKWPVSIIP
jgi:integrase